MFVNKEAVGKRILQIRKKYGYSMQKFGEIIDNAPKGSVNSWEKGVNLPNEKRLKQIATLGNMTLNELLYGSFKEYVDMLITAPAAQAATRRLVSLFIVDHAFCSAGEGGFWFSV